MAQRSMQLPWHSSRECSATVHRRADELRAANFRISNLLLILKSHEVVNFGARPISSLLELFFPFVTDLVEKN
jgi:hypothetical protein